MIPIPRKTKRPSLPKDSAAMLQFWRQQKLNPNQLDKFLANYAAARPSSSSSSQWPPPPGRPFRPSLPSTSLDRVGSFGSGGTTQRSVELDALSYRRLLFWMMFIPSTPSHGYSALNALHPTRIYGLQSLCEILMERDYGPKWEGLPLTTVDEGEGQPGGLAGDVKEEVGPKQPEEETKLWYKDPKKFCKVVLPHVILLFILLSYISISSAVIQFIEADQDVTLRLEKLDEILTHYEVIVNETWAMHSEYSPVTYDIWSGVVRSRLVALSIAHEGQELSLNASEISTRWTFQSAVLYTLTIITTCGYDRVTVNTDAGKIFSVAFALVGIPLMFITAADIGKFLSETVLFILDKASRLCRFLKARCCRRGRPSSDREGKKTRLAPEVEAMMDEEEGIQSVTQSLWFPIGAYIGLICSYCALGGFMYASYENWPFVRSFHFSFNTITTVGLGNVEVVDYLYLALNVAYIIIGLAIVTMCIDLASTHLKAYFRRIHYFGRPAGFLGVSEEIKQLMHLIGTIRRKKGGKVTWDDLKDYIDFESVALAAYAPSNMSSWRYMDETSSCVSTFRPHTNSITSADLLSSITIGDVSLRKNVFGGANNKI